MPIYEYKCICGNEFKALRTEDNEVSDPKCPKCGSSELEKTLTSSLMPSSDNLGNMKYSVCIDCIKQNCNTCEVNLK